jgi:hypothetical protein
MNQMAKVRTATGVGHSQMTDYLLSREVALEWVIPCRLF